MPPFFSWDLGSSLLLLLWIFPQGDCLSSFRLVVLLGFYLTPSSRTYFSAISLYLILCICGLSFPSCKTTILLGSGAFPLAGEFRPSDRQDCLKWYVYRWLLGEARCQNGHLCESSQWWAFPGVFTTPVLALTESHSWPRLPRTPAWEPKVGLAHVSMKSLLCPGSQCMWNLVCTLQEWSLLFPPVLWSTYSQARLVFKAKCSGGSFSWFQTPRLGSLMWGSELSLLWDSLCDMIIFQFAGHPPTRFGSWL